MFQGYSDETFEFFMAIRFNNNADFFHSNHNWYKSAVREPSLALAEALAPTIEWIDDAFERRPNRVVSRINRDIRFSNDKSPYRDYLWLSFRRPKEDRERHGVPGFYMDIGVSGSSYGMGFYWPNKPLLNALRRRMTIEPEPLTAILTPIEAQFKLCGDFYKRMPVPEHLPDPLARLYPAKSFYYEKDLTDFNLLKSPALADEIISGYRLLAPLYRYLTELVPEADADDTVDHTMIP